MTFLGMGTMEILIILLVAFIFLGPERMVDAARTLGKWTGELRRMGSTVQAEMDELTNVGAPLSSRRVPGGEAHTQSDSAHGTDAAEPPLDQSHPPDFVRPDEPPRNVENPVAFRGSSSEQKEASPAKPSTSSSDEANAASREGGA